MKRKSYIQVAAQAWKEKEARWLKPGDIILLDGECAQVDSIEILLSCRITDPMGDPGLMLKQQQQYLNLNEKVDVAQKGLKWKNSSKI